MKKALVVLGTIVLVALAFLAGTRFTRRTAPAAESGRKVLYYRDPMKPQITSPTPKKSSDGMDYVAVYEGQGGPSSAPGSERRGIWIDPRMAQDSGVRVDAIRRQPLNRAIRTVGQVTYDERRVFMMNAKFMGWIEKLYADYTGKRVRKGEPLMEIYSPDLVASQEEYLLAFRNRKALEASTLPGVRTSADELLRSARRRLELFDVPQHEIEELEQRGTARKTVMLHSPTSGYVIEKTVVAGTQVTPGAPLLKIADLSNVWVIADVYQYELGWVKPGMPAEVELSYLPGKTFTGTVTYVYPYLTPETKTAKVRVEVRNAPAAGELKPDMFATVVIRSPVAREAVVVPEQAIIHTGSRNVAVIALGDGYFEPRDLKLGVAVDNLVEVLEGVSAGERIVTSSQFLIDAESNLRSAVAAMSRPAPQATAVTGAGSAGSASGEHAHNGPSKPGAMGADVPAAQHEEMQMGRGERP